MGTMRCPQKARGLGVHHLTGQKQDGGGLQPVPFLDLTAGLISTSVPAVAAVQEKAHEVDDDRARSGHSRREGRDRERELDSPGRRKLSR